MRGIIPIVACVTVLGTVASSAILEANVDSTTVEAGRAIFKGKVDTSQMLVVRIDRDGKPVEWRSGGLGDAFEVVVETSDKIPLDGGQTGHGFVVTIKQGTLKVVLNVHLEGDLAGTFTIRTKEDLVTKAGVITFADVTLKNGKKLSVSFRLEPIKK